ncbi:lactate racemase domain-containing protein [Kribbella sp. CA-293567]|uniref:lactate racemase domain-containing protein n=1 Tax=Kribbella sp. CA-293567 TaxID=3002436 RepID=UPI0022DD5F05|nr:lactate racemase domain-containing protein [Kribbella sp. CA-293567]WBQ05956.1 lactate racemase domain-containing protein [Kribbella sp. CA-293567]
MSGGKEASSSGRPWGPFEAIRGLRPDGVLPQVTPIRRLLHDVPTEADPYAAAQAALAPLATAIRPGDRIAVTAGSRGIHDLVTVVRAAVDWLRAAGAEPFVVPAMGSHGGATADGQREMLAGLGVTAESVGCPVEATMETVVLGNLPDGTPVHHDALAAKADGVLLINRVKPHTDFHGPVESGLGKILAIGLGNHQGAATLHAGGIPSLGAAIEAAAKLIVGSGKILGGLAILENAYEKTAAVELVVADGIASAAENALLQRAAGLMARLPFEQLDVLVVDELGKDKSGTGMDTNVLGRCWVFGIPEFESPSIAAVSVHRLSDASHGNASGLGLADVVPARILEQIDLQASYVNALTSGAGGARRSRLPMVLEDDAAAILGAVTMSGRRDWSELRLARIRDTLSPNELMVSPALLDEAAERFDLEITGSARELTDVTGTLTGWGER